MIRRARGVLDYVGDGIGARGREEWLFTAHEDGTRTLRAHCEMWDTELYRDVVHTVSEAFRPLRTFISQRLRGEFLGEGWFQFRDTTIDGAVELCESGRSDQRLPLTEQPRFFIPHAVCCDGWIVPAYDLSSGGRQQLSAGWRSSPTANGSTGPLVEPMDAVRIMMLGEQRVTVAAGTFDTLHFAIEQDGGARDELWTTTCDYLLVQLRSDALNSWYRLRELEIAPAGPPPIRSATG